MVPPYTQWGQWHAWRGGCIEGARGPASANALIKTVSSNSFHPFEAEAESGVEAVTCSVMRVRTNTHTDRQNTIHARAQVCINGGTSTDGGTLPPDTHTHVQEEKEKEMHK